MRQRLFRLRAIAANLEHRWSVLPSSRCISTCLKWPNDSPTLEVADIKRIENHWRDAVTTRPGHDMQRPSTSAGKESYVLSMFPYPSGQLHMGHVRVYTIGDVLARFRTLNGERVLQPIGWDAFGLPAENAAKEHQMCPSEWTRTNIEQMREQIVALGASFDWDTELVTCRSDYYRWTQWLFLQLYDAGLVHRRSSLVNYDPVDATVLADEQIDDEGRSWRSGAKVEKKVLRQWMVRTNRFAKQMSDNLTSMPHYREINAMQKSWIGNPKFTAFYLPLVDRHSPTKSLDEDILILLHDARQLHHAELIVVDRNHILYKLAVQDYPEMANPSVMHILPSMAINPVNQRRLPIIVLADADCSGWFAKRTDDGYTIKDDVDHVDAHLVMVMKHTAVDGQGDVLQSDLMRLGEADEKMLTALGDNRELDGHKDLCRNAMENEYGGYLTSSHLRDWCVSRQRYWGTPIPIVHCPSCGTVPVADNELPVKLPDVTTIPPATDARSPLASIEEWVNVPCPQCHGPAKRETDTLDTFFDSSWYFLRYTDPKNTKMPFDTEKADLAMPVNVYVGGKEHAIMHLFYARFMTQFLHSIGLLTHCDEPFVRLLPQGIVKARTYVAESTGRFVKKEDVIGEGEDMTDMKTGERVTIEWHKMSKSKHNGVDPVEMLGEYGADLTRALIVSNVSPYKDRNWENEEWRGVLHWLSRVRFVVNDYVRQTAESSSAPDAEKVTKVDAATRESYNFFIRMITHNLTSSHLLNVSVSRMHGLTNALRKCPTDMVAHSSEHARALRALLVVMSPITPHIAAELWSAMHAGLANKGDVWEQAWPLPDVDSVRDIVVFIDDVRCGSIKIQNEVLLKMEVEEAFELVTKEKKVAKLLGKQKVNGMKMIPVEFVGAELRITAEGKGVMKGKMKNDDME